MNYNFLIICMSVLCIIAMVALLVDKKPVENFTCSFDPTAAGRSAMESYQGCLVQCGNSIAEGDANAANCLSTTNGRSGCEEKCSAALGDTGPCSFKGGPNNNEDLTRCIINERTDIRGTNLDNCVNNCRTATCDGCTNFRHYDTRSGTIIEGTYTTDINEYNKYCNSDPANHQYCSPCIEKCLACRNPANCSWIKSEDQQIEERNLFNNHSFRIGVIPEDRAAVIVWNENTSNVNKYLIYIYKKSDKNINSSEQQSPIMVRTIEKEFKGQGNNSHKITGLTNGVTYSITVNKVSSIIADSSNNKLVKASNTIDVVPSFVNLINFSQLNKDRTLKQEKLKSVGTMDSLRGKKLNFNIS